VTAVSFTDSAAARPASAATAATGPARVARPVANSISASAGVSAMTCDENRSRGGAMVKNATTSSPPVGPPKRRPTSQPPIAESDHPGMARD
jgi:hypothetical protein